MVLLKGYREVPTIEAGCYEQPLACEKVLNRLAVHVNRRLQQILSEYVPSIDDLFHKRSHAARR